MPKKKYTDEDARKDFKALWDSCSEGYTGEWDCSTDEGRQGFQAMQTLLLRLDKHYGITSKQGGSMPKKKEPVLVVKIRDGVVDEVKLFTDPKRAEECFTLAALDIGARKDDMECILDDGYYQGMNFSVCLTHPEVL